MRPGLNILIVEDEYFAHRLLKKTLLASGYQVMEGVLTIEQALYHLKKGEVDLAILDINLGDAEKDGIWLGDYIQKHIKIPFMYLTAYETTDVVKRAIQTMPVAYLTKPFNATDVIASIELTVQKYTAQHENNNYLLAKKDDFFVRIKFIEIDFIEAKGNYLLVSSKNVIYKYRSTIKKIRESLPENYFIQTHRAYIVNINSVERYHSSVLQINAFQIPVSDSYRAEVFQRLNDRNNTPQK